MAEKTEKKNRGRLIGLLILISANCLSMGDLTSLGARSEKLVKKAHAPTVTMARPPGIQPKAAR